MEGSHPLAAAHPLHNEHDLPDASFFGLPVRGTVLHRRVRQTRGSRLDMRNVERIKRLVKQDVWTADLEGMPRFQRVVVRLVRLAYAVALEFRHRLLDARAAGLVYATILSLVPLLAVMFSVLKGFGAHHLIQPVLAQLLEPLGEKGQEITSNVIGFVDQLKVGVLGIVGVAGLFYTAYSLIDRIEQALNAIWRVRRGRSWARKFTDYLSVILVGPVLVVAALGLMASIQNQALVQRVVAIQPLGSLLILAAGLVPFLLLCGVFTFAYKFIPYTEVTRHRRSSVGSRPLSCGASSEKRSRRSLRSRPATASSTPGSPC